MRPPKDFKRIFLRLARAFVFQKENVFSRMIILYHSDSFCLKVSFVFWLGILISGMTVTEIGLKMARKGDLESLLKTDQVLFFHSLFFNNILIVDYIKSEGQFI